MPLSARPFRSRLLSNWILTSRSSIAYQRYCERPPLELSSLSKILFRFVQVRQVHILFCLLGALCCTTILLLYAIQCCIVVPYCTTLFVPRLMNKQHECLLCIYIFQFFTNKTNSFTMAFPSCKLFMKDFLNITLNYCTVIGEKDWYDASFGTEVYS